MTAQQKALKEYEKISKGLRSGTKSLVVKSDDRHKAAIRLTHGQQLIEVLAHIKKLERQLAKAKANGNDTKVRKLEVLRAGMIHKARLYADLNKTPISG